ncbi:MAG: M20/M25/M40 family metallo-hydrolase, partial [Sphingomonadaceae bacterium]
DFDALKAAPDSAVRGKIVYVGHAMEPTQDGSSYGQFGPLRFAGANAAAKKGAAAIVIRSIGTDSHRNPHAGGTNFDSDVAPIPAAALSNPDADNLERMFARTKAVRMKLVLTPRNIGTQQSGNVIAEVPGSDPSAGIVLIGGHLDSWDLGTGAVDDATGVAITAAAAKRIMDAGKPRRTIRVVWFGAEEVGLLGARAYAQRHKDEHHAIAGESDFGAGRIWRFETKLPDSAKSVADRLEAALSPLGVVRGRGMATGGPDSGQMVALGVSAIDLNQDGTDYFNLHHTPDDTLDKVDLEALRQNVAAWTTMLSIVANAHENISFTAP